MKYKLLLLVLSFSVIITSCKKDKANQLTPDATITLKPKVVGLWTLNKITTDAYDASGKLVKTQDAPAGFDQNWEFLANNTATSSDFRGVKNYTYSFSTANAKNYISIKSTSTVTYEVGADNSKMTWVMQGPSTDPAYTTTKQTYNFTKK